VGVGGAGGGGLAGAEAEAGAEAGDEAEAGAEAEAEAEVPCAPTCGHRARCTSCARRACRRPPSPARSRRSTTSRLSGRVKVRASVRSGPGLGASVRVREGSGPGQGQGQGQGQSVSGPGPQLRVYLRRRALADDAARSVLLVGSTARHSSDGGTCAGLTRAPQACSVPLWLMP
jgi:hypothetical protein